MSKVTYLDEFSHPVTYNANDIVCTHCGDRLAKHDNEEENKCHGSYFCGGIGEYGGHDNGMRAWLFGYIQKNRHTKLEDAQPPKDTE